MANELCTEEPIRCSVLDQEAGEQKNSTRVVFVPLYLTNDCVGFWILSTSHCSFCHPSKMMVSMNNLLDLVLVRVYRENLHPVGCWVLSVCVCVCRDASWWWERVTKETVGENENDRISIQKETTPNSNKRQSNNDVDDPCRNKKVHSRNVPSSSSDTGPCNRLPSRPY